MLPKEAARVAEFLLKLPVQMISPVANIGSGDFEYRTKKAPYIDSLLVKPLEHYGAKIVHIDQFAAPGIDIQGNIYNPEVQARLKRLSFKTILLCNIFEHVGDRVALANICRDILTTGGYVVITVPKEFPYHAAPIDTLFRPDPSELACLFPGFDTIETSIIKECTYKEFIRNYRSGILREIIYTIFRSLLPFYKPRGCLTRIALLMWLNRHFKVSFIALRKTW